MIKVIHFIHGLNSGGAETLVKNYALNIDKNIFQFKILCLDHCKNSSYEKLLIDNGINIIFVCDFQKFYNKKNIIFKVYNKIEKYFIIRKIIKDEKPNIIHTHLPINKYIKFARPNNDTKLVYTMHGDPKRYKKIDYGDYKAVNYLIKKYNMKIICLHEEMKNAVKLMYKTTNVEVLNNGIELDKFKNAKSKEDIRNDLKIGLDKFVIGHVGRFSKVKNHDFLINIFIEIKKKNENAFLLLIGDGEEKSRIKKLLDDNKFQDSYLILSNRADIPDLLSAMDVFVFPSISEGLGISLIEAQEAKLLCFASDRVPNHVVISNLVTIISLSFNEKQWAKSILNKKKNADIIVNDFEWDIKKITKKLEDLYIKL